MNKNYLFTSESVSEGHPDKVCDIISDSVVDDFLSQENPENSRVAMETLVTTNKVVTAWIALTKSDKSSGALEVVPKSYKLGLIKKLDVRMCGLGNVLNFLE